MESLYREKWTAKFAHPVEAVAAERYTHLKADYWAMLDRLTPDEIRAGLDQCLERFEFPPVPRDFYRAAKDAWAARKPRTYFKALPAPRDKEKAAEAVAQMREMLGC